MATPFIFVVIQVERETVMTQRLGDQGLKVSAISWVHKKLIEQFKNITFKHLSHEKNYLADALAILATMFKVNANIEAHLVKLEVRESQAHCACIQEESDGNPWYHDILRYIKDQ